MKQLYCAEIQILTNHTFKFEANSPEEAISLAEAELSEGTLGEMDAEFDIISTDAYPVDDNDDNQENN